MKLVIDIPEEIKAVIDRNGTNEIVAERIWQAIKEGTPLPQGHELILVSEMFTEDGQIVLFCDIDDKLYRYECVADEAEKVVAIGKVLEIIDKWKYDTTWCVREDIWNERMNAIKGEILALMGGGGDVK